MGCISSTPSQRRHNPIPASHNLMEKLPAESQTIMSVGDENASVVANTITKHGSAQSSSQTSIPTGTPPKPSVIEAAKNASPQRTQDVPVVPQQTLPQLAPMPAEPPVAPLIKQSSNKTAAVVSGGVATGSSRSIGSIAGLGQSGRLDPLAGTTADPAVHVIRKLDDCYDVDRSKRIGKGHYASVYVGRSKATGQRVAVKMIEKRLSKAERLALEVNVMRKAGAHPNIVQLIDVFESDTQLQLVLELVEGGELFEYLVEHGPYSEATAAMHIRDVTKAIAFLHSQNIIHRDLKPENLLLTSKDESARVKVADFGLAKLMVADVTRTVCGTWAYCAYEVKKPNGFYDNKCDVWSIGVIAFILLSAYHPFDPQGDSTDDEIWDRISKCDYNFDDPAWNSVSDSAKDFVSKLLVHDPAKRMSAEEALQHPWLHDVAEPSPDVETQPALSPAINDKLKDYQARSRMNPLQKAAYAMKQRMNWISSSATSNSSNTANSSNSPSSAKRRMVIAAAAAAAAARNSARRAAGATGQDGPSAGTESPNSNKGRSWSMGSGRFNVAAPVAAAQQRNSPSPQNIPGEEKAESPTERSYISSPLRTAMVLATETSGETLVTPPTPATGAFEKLEKAEGEDATEVADGAREADTEQQEAAQEAQALSETVTDAMAEMDAIEPSASPSGDAALIATTDELILPDEEDIEDDATMRSSDLDTVSEEEEDPETTGDHALDEPSFQSAKSSLTVDSPAKV